MYADDICVVAPTTIALQKLLDVRVCYEYGITNELEYNPPKSACMVFKPRRFKLYCPTVAIAYQYHNKRRMFEIRGYIQTSRICI